jgi:hypothetical protein
MRLITRRRIGGRCFGSPLVALLKPPIRLLKAQVMCRVDVVPRQGRSDWLNPPDPPAERRLGRRALSGELLIRVVVGGLVISAFAVVGDTLKPKPSPASLAAPRPSPSPRSLSPFGKDVEYVGLEARSMLAGAIALVVYSLLVCRLLLRSHGRAPVSSVVAASASWLVWLAVALGIWSVMLR